MHHAPKAAAALLSVAAFACGPSGPISIEILSYNVAALPEGLSQSNPEVNIPLIGPKLNAYPLVLVQEDFSYHERLARRPTHEFRSEPKVAEKAVNDGLNRFSRVPFSGLERHTWRSCSGAFDSGSDCLADKGFSAATTTITEGGLAVVINLHHDAGGGEGDTAARADQVEQVLEFIATIPAERALIVAGDFNLKPGRRPPDAPIFNRYFEGTGLIDACAQLNCGEERIDKILFRPGDGLPLQAETWRAPPEFVDDAGMPLSDHLPLAVRLSWDS